MATEHSLCIHKVSETLKAKKGVIRTTERLKKRKQRKNKPKTK
jgi:hypothetical protein